ncbi:MAG: phosphonate transporter, periplasmic phosphonate-binding protein [Phycisphaerales bacterium]|nr:phosphonate transporter, periplasmic phosphonate-binding protein [Phycisphaerales bacterium]
MMRARSGKAASTAALIIALIALAVAVFGVVYKQQVSNVKEGTAEQEAMYRRMTGLDNPAARNALDARYTDADGDLVADAPTDASKQIDPPTLKFSYVAVEDDADFKIAFKELMAAISTATGKPVEYASYSSGEDELRDLRDGKLHIAGLNTGSVPIGVCTAGFVPVSQLADSDGNAGYHMEIIAQPNSPIAKITDLRGHELALTEPNSNSGYKAPLVRLRENNLRPPTDYLIRYSQGHIQSIAGIKNKSFEAAAVAGDVLKRETGDGHIAASDYKVIYTSDETFPGAAVGYASILKPELAAKIKAVLTGFDWKGTGLEKSFAAEGKSKFVPADYKKQWDFVRRIDESIGFSYALHEPATSQPAAVASK